MELNQGDRVLLKSTLDNALIKELIILECTDKYVKYRDVMSKFECWKSREELNRLYTLEEVLFSSFSALKRTIELEKEFDKLLKLQYLTNDHISKYRSTTT